MDNKGYLREIAELNDRLKASYEREEESARRFSALEAERDGLRERVKELEFEITVKELESEITQIHRSYEPNFPDAT